jgi:peptidoglycan/xylan/chitin deacetylase (PgdA/CDA1 family)
MRLCADVPHSEWRSAASLDDAPDSLISDDPEKPVSIWERASRRVSHRLVRLFPHSPCRLELDRPLASFTFDDVPESAHSRGAALLETYGATGTFYISTGLLGRRTKHWRLIDAAGVRDLHDRGHELGLHTHSHQQMGSFDRAHFAQDLCANIAALRAIAPQAKFESFAFPFGMAAWRHRDVLARTVRSSRSVFAGINSGMIDRHFIKTVELGDARLTAEALQAYIDEAARRRGWLVFLTHDVVPSPTQYGATPKRLAAALARCRQQGFDIVPVAAALAAIERSNKGAA